MSQSKARPGRNRHAMRLLAFCAAVGCSAASWAADVRVMCYQDGNECDVTAELAKRFEAKNPGTKIIIDKVPYKTVVEQLPVQLASGQGPDIARVTEIGGLAKYYLDIGPYVQDRNYWEKNFGNTLSWMRTSAGDKGIYGLLSQLTVTGPYVNKTLFEQANVPLPGPKATWDDWVAATRKVAKATQLEAAMAWDRSGHRFAGPAISYGAKLFNANGDLVIDDGYKALVQKFVGWNKDGTMSKEVWAGAGGSAYRDGFEDFKNGRIVMYLSGSWQIRRMSSQIGKNFDWIVVPNPCGPAACSGMPGGAAFVALKGSKSPKEAGRFLDFLAQEDIYAEMMAKTENLPAHQGLVQKGINYASAPEIKAALAVFSTDIPRLSPLAYRLQGYQYNRSLMFPTVTRVTQAIVGEMSVNDAMTRLSSDMAESVRQAKK
ncbi:ABC-type sugar transport system, periplasmic component [Herbaspirillum sp. CF444]|uniref:ABC transporter substrate-binding protein n=1 Tax=Herbaspirillum sp. CF444 TaxID=1144319 RepID=UPI000272518B|nr:ABC transporter substrate-binding protein [Herbaspirillum sp. CF444]EJL91914.1 ABC-type sugar transport system, periplasmic component [Herbaspirillum sp. CF444]